MRWSCLPVGLKLLHTPGQLQCWPPALGGCQVGPLISNCRHVIRHHSPPGHFRVLARQKNGDPQFSREASKRETSKDPNKPLIHHTLLSTLIHLPMASRRLALNLAQGLRGRAGLSLPMKRGLATPVSPAVKTQTTTLKNGLTVSLTLPNHAIDRRRDVGNHLLTSIDAPRSLPSTLPMRRPRPSACGSMPAPGQRQKRPTAPHTSSSISLSR